MSQVLHPMLNVAIKAARSAGNLISRASMDLEALKISSKSPNDYVTEVDKNAEDLIINTLLTAYPDHGILAEESGSHYGTPHSDFIWIIDPLDGTTNFIHGFPVYAVSIALAFRGQVQQAVVYDPTRNDLFIASKGKGAFLNHKRLRVSRRSRMQEALISTGFPFRKGDNFKRYMQMLEAVMPTCAGLRRPGAAALDLCYLAAGYTDGFFETGLHPWDIAAGSLMVTEAGGLIGNFTGESDYLHQNEVVAGSPRIYGHLVSLLTPFSQMAPPPVASAPTLAHSDAGGATATSAFTASVVAAQTPLQKPSKTSAKPYVDRGAPQEPKHAITPLAATKAPVRIKKQVATETQTETPRNWSDDAAKPHQADDAPF
jgi:myo-inositol-1(or 4)-monophosphatase